MRRGLFVALALVLAPVLSGCTSNGPDDVADPEAPSEQASETSPAPQIPLGADEAMVMNPWNNSDELEIFAGPVEVQVCADSVVPDFCLARFLRDSPVPVGTAGFRIEASGTDIPLGVTLGTNRLLQLKGDVLTSGYEWQLALPVTYVASHWSLPDHNQSGLGLKLYSPAPAPPGTSADVRIFAQRAPGFEGVLVPRGYNEVANHQHLDRDVLLLAEATVMAESTAGSGRGGKLLPFDNGRYVPPTTESLVVVLQWTPSTDCPPDHDCRAALQIGSKWSTTGFTIRADWGADWTIFAVKVNIASSAVWSELPTDDSATVLMIDAIACTSASSGGNCVGPLPHYTSSFALETTVHVEAWARDVDLESIKRRYALE